ncbi:MAG: hypothetical protein MJ132_03220, partial [Clostridia bacterium]|nr:hypothetical protein [Clostridia bacterium]
NDQWATYTATLPNDGNSYYIYVGGAKGEWNGKELLIDNVVINDSANNNLAAEDFSAGLCDSIFNFTKTNSSDLPVVTEKSDKTVDTANAAAINIDQIKAADNSQMSFITKKAYPGGSTVTFDAYVPSDASWWGICWTTDANVNSVYNVFNSKGKNFSSQKGQWATYTATLPNDGNDYYFYIGGAKGEWHSEALLIDNVVINGANGYTLGEEDFAGGLENSIFKTDAAVSLADLTPVEPEQTDLFIGTQTKNGQTRLVMKLCADAETIEAYDSVAFKVTINGVEETIAVDCVYDSFYNGGALVTAESIDCTYVAILEIGNISGKTVTVQGVINGTEEGVARTLK